MNKELSNVLKAIILVTLITIISSWVYSILDNFGIDKVGEFEIRFGFFAINSAMIAGIFILMALHCRNRYRLGDEDFLFPFKALSALSLVGIYDTLEAICGLGDDISYLKVIVELFIGGYLLINYYKECKRNGSI